MSDKLHDALGLDEAGFKPRDRVAELEDGLVEVAGMGAEADERITMIEDALVELAGIIAGGDE